MRKLNVLLIMCLVVIVASTVRAQGSPGVNNAELSGNYAFTFNGMTTGAAAPPRSSPLSEDSRRTGPGI